MRTLVVGATGGSGRAVVEHLLSRGHQVTALCREAGAIAPSDRLRVVIGDATNAEDVERAVRGQEAVVVTLGIRENPLKVRLLGSARTPIDVRSVGTRAVIAAMQKHGVRRLVVQTSYGVGETRDRLRWIERLFFALLLAPQIADTEKQNRAVVESGLDWVIAQPVHLTDDPDDRMPFLSTEGATARMKISRRSVGRFLAEAVESSAYVGKTVSISGTLEASRSAITLADEH